MLKKLSDEEISDLKLAFKHFDKDGNERISLNELGAVMKTLLGQKLDNKRLQCVIESADKNGDKVLDFDEFLAFINRSVNEQKAENFRSAFRIHDKDQNGLISKAEFRRVIEAFGTELSDEELKSMMKEVDTNRDGQINYEEFLEFITNK